MAIEMRMPGSPRSVKAVADWLDAVKDAVSNVDVDLAQAKGESDYYWRGRSGRAWGSAVSTVRERAEDLPGFLGDAVEVFRAYANRLKRVQEDFDTLLHQAGEVGLTVVGKTVFPPTTTLDYCPAPGAPEEDLEEYDDYLRKVASYRDLGEKVGTRIGELDAWIGEKIVPLIARIANLKPLGGTVKALSDNGNAVPAELTLEAYKTYLDGNLSRWREHHDALQDAADAFRSQLRSGNPALSAAADAADPRAMGRSIAELGERIGKVSKLAKGLPVAGHMLDIVSIADELAGGGSLSSALAELGGSMGGGALGGGGAAALAGAIGSNPIGWVVGGTIVGGVTIGAGSRYLWEAAVPLNTRESIDSYFTDGKPRLDGYIPPSSRAYRGR